MSTSKTTTTTQQEKTLPQQGTTQTDESSNPQQGQGVTSTDVVKKEVGRTPPAVKDIRKLFVGGLPSNVNDQLFREFFEFFGEVSDSIVMIDRETGHSRGFGFVTFREEETAYKVLGGKGNSINTVEIFGKLCEVKVSIPKQHSSSSSSGNSSNRRNNKSASSSRGSNNRNQETNYGSFTNNDAVMSHEMGASFPHHGVQDGYIENYQYGNYMMANGTYMPPPPPYPHHYDMMGYNPTMNHPANYNYHLPPPHFQPSGSYYTMQSPPLPFSHQQQQQPHPMPPFMNNGYPVNTNYSGVAQDQAVVSSSSSYDQNYPRGPPMTYPDQQMSQQLPNASGAGGPPPPSVPHAQYPNNTMLYPTSYPAASYHGTVVVPPNNYVHHPIPYNVVQGAGAGGEGEGEGEGAVDTNNNNNKNNNNESAHSPCSYPEEISNVTECEDLDQEKNNE